MNTGEIPHHPILWIIGLVAAISAAIIATVIDSYVKGSASRAHHGVQLFNECLAEHFAAYLVFFFAFATGTTFSEYWGTGLLAISSLLVIGFYIRAVYSTTKHEVIIASDHACAGRCTNGLRFVNVLRMCGLNLVFAALMFGVSCYLASITIKNPPQ